MNTPNLPTLIPHIPVSDGEAAIAFYDTAFGFTLQGKHAAEDGKRLMHAHLERDGSALFLHDEFPEYGACPGAIAPQRLGGSSCTLHLEVPDADVAWQRALDAGATVAMPLDNQFWGARYGVLTDPFGHTWSIGGPIRE